MCTHYVKRSSPRTSARDQPQPPPSRPVPLLRFDAEATPAPCAPRSTKRTSSLARRHNVDFARTTTCGFRNFAPFVESSPGTNASGSESYRPGLDGRLRGFHARTRVKTRPGPLAKRKSERSRKWLSRARLTKIRDTSTFFLGYDSVDFSLVKPRDTINTLSRRRTVLDIENR